MIAAAMRLRAPADVRSGDPARGPEQVFGHVEPLRGRAPPVGGLRHPGGHAVSLCRADALPKFANFLAEAEICARRNTQSMQRACAIAALSVLAGVPSPVDDALVRDVRAGLRRTLRAQFGGPEADLQLRAPGRGAGAGYLLSPPPPGDGGGAEAPPSVRKRAQAQAMRCAVILDSGPRVGRPAGRRPCGWPDRGRDLAPRHDRPLHLGIED